MIRANTPVFKFIGYLETTGGPVCICPANILNNWTGAKNTDGLYWEAIGQIGNELIEKYKGGINFFITETGNFTLWRCEKGLVTAEIISIQLGGAIPWAGLQFNCNLEERFPFNLEGLIGFFDSALTIKSIESECLIALDDAAVWNAAFVKCEFNFYTEMSFSDDTIVMKGFWFN